MGYRIDYPGQKRKRNPNVRKRKTARLLIFILSVLLLLPVAAPRGRKIMMQLMLPEEPASSAIGTVVQNMHEDGDIETALHAFCEAVICIDP